MDKMTGRSRAFGFVEMATHEEAQAAIEMWNGKDLDGRKLTVNQARPMPSPERKITKRSYGLRPKNSLRLRSNVFPKD
jgi:RNA recognition motif-containing protein